MLRPSPLVLAFSLSLLLAGCGADPGRPDAVAKACPACPACPGAEPAKPAAKPLQAALWSDLPGWADDDPRPTLAAFRASCATLGKRDPWQAVCAAAVAAPIDNPAVARAWFEARFSPWALTNPDGERLGLVTGYYEPVIKGSRQRKPPFVYPVFGPPDDLIDVELSDLYPELKHMRLRGRIEGRKLVPYYTHAEWESQGEQRADQALLWTDDLLDFLFMQIQGSGQVELTDGSRVRLNYADQNGQPFRSIARYLVDQGELKLEQASMQGVKAWARAHPKRVRELVAANPSEVFFRELPLTGDGPPGALGVPLTPQRSLAVDPRYVTLGAPIFLATTHPNDSRPLQRLMIAQDTGGAIRGVVRADFYWGSGPEAGIQAGRMRQKGRMWILMPAGFAPN